MRGQLLPITSERFVLRAPAIGDDLPVTFMEPDGDGTFQYLHMGARLHRPPGMASLRGRPMR